EREKQIVVGVRLVVPDLQATPQVGGEVIAIGFGQPAIGVRHGALLRGRRGRQQRRARTAGVGVGPSRLTPSGVSVSPAPQGLSMHGSVYRARVAQASTMNTVSV